MLRSHFWPSSLPLRPPFQPPAFHLPPAVPVISTAKVHYVFDTVNLGLHPLYPRIRETLAPFQRSRAGNKHGKAAAVLFCPHKNAEALLCWDRDLAGM